jgi:gamma-glutamyltranspeptidase/glutathione hydrolase
MLKTILLLLSVCTQGFAGCAVVSAHPLATQAGVAILEKGGNAFDAAVAVASTLTVVEPAMTGLGGYGTTLIYDAKKMEIRYLDSCGRFPIHANSDLMRAPTENYLQNRQGPKSITTPGMLHGWEKMHTIYGKLAWNELFDSAINHAKEGFALTPYIAKLIGLFFDDFSKYTKFFYGKDGIPLKVGETLIQKDLARTYEIIAKEGTHPYYQGEIAHQIDQQMQEMGSFLSLEDLKRDEAQWWDPLKVRYNLNSRKM